MGLPPKLAGPGAQLRQLGLAEECASEDLKKLSLAYDAAEGQRGEPLLSLKAEYPILFEALEASFGLLPPPTRAVEQKRGGLRSSRLAGLGHGFTGEQQRCKGHLAPRMGLPQGAAAGWHLGGSERARGRSDQKKLIRFEISMPELPKMPTLASI